MGVPPRGYIKILNYLWDFKNLRSWYYHDTTSILSNDCWYIFRMPFHSDILILFNDILIYQNIRLTVRFCWYYHDIWYKTIIITNVCCCCRPREGKNTICMLKTQIHVQYGGQNEPRAFIIFPWYLATFTICRGEGWSPTVCGPPLYTMWIIVPVTIIY